MAAPKDHHPKPDDDLAGKLLADTPEIDTPRTRTKLRALLNELGGPDRMKRTAASLDEPPGNWETSVEDGPDKPREKF